jgi:glutamate dehydrogenase
MKFKENISEILAFSKKQNYPKNFPKNLFFDYVQLTLSQSDSTDFLKIKPTDAYNFLLSNFNFILNKKDSFKVRVYSPNKKNDSFESDYTIIDIVSNDMPFLVDSITGYLQKISISFDNIIHPIFCFKRDAKGNLQQINKYDRVNKKEAESVIQIHITKLKNPADLSLIEKNISKIIESVDIVVSDWKKMSALAIKTKDFIENGKKYLADKKEVDESKEFIDWAVNGNFIFLGAKEFAIKEVEKNKYILEEEKNSALGVFRSNYQDIKPAVANSSTEEVCMSVKNPYVIEILKSRYKSSIHRITNAERIRVQKISSDGKVVGEIRLIGLFTSSAYHQSPHEIPRLRNKIAKVIKDSNYFEGSHSYKDLISVLESYPRDELFQTNAEDLLRISNGIVSICGRSQVKFFARKDKYNRFVSCLIFMPRDKSNSEVRYKIKQYLAKIYDGEVTDTMVEITESKLTRFHVIIRTDKGIKDVDQSEVEQKISSMIILWSDELKKEILNNFEKNSIDLIERYSNAFSVSYTNRFDVKRAVRDIEKIEEVIDRNSIVVDLYNQNSSQDEFTELKIYNQKELILSEMMPILESFGLKIIQEHTYQVSFDDKNKKNQVKKVWIHYFRLKLGEENITLDEKLKINFENSVIDVWNNILEISNFNKLAIVSAVSSKDIFILLAYYRYIYQTGFIYSQEQIAKTLVKHRNIAFNLVELFKTKFNPKLFKNFEERSKAINKINNQITSDLAKVSEILDDVIIKKFLNIINATLRTNFYQNENGFKGYVSFKIDSKQVKDLPLPVPFAEIFVYSSFMEGIHLRGGKVARGGLRWSDRHDDFRTEVLGLVKAQTTKNAVIVPVGSKGGFVVKKSTQVLSREEIQQNGIFAYKTFLRGLLDITDNIISGKVSHPKNTILFDSADPYLVVAADKGTATFSDIANSLSAEYNFWLGDAFASGGSVGYDHKKMGITAKGAWVSVKRHFSEIGIDTQSQDFTCVGIGDLAGDVFGNGMLLSKHIKLVAAFNHLHIFLDPNPNPEKSFLERVRMFNLPRSSWLDYDKKLISAGGGIFERSAKSIKISQQVKKSLSISEDEMTPNDLIKAILKAEVDLLFNGGIGTYVKSQEENNIEVGDKANDALRINGCELRCKVVGEGGNLGFTQKGRIEFALKGGKINTDAMDNSAGVDCSDHEVNIKIALIQAMKNKKITLEQRNKILDQMTDNVADLVLDDNKFQTQAITIAHYQGYSVLSEYSQFLDQLEKTRLLNRKVEFLPSKKEIEKRILEKTEMTRPELCVMLAYSKMEIYNALLESKLVEDSYFEKKLMDYFPDLMKKSFKEEILNHQLRKEIIATQVTNMIVNKLGITFVNQICFEKGCAIEDVVKSIIIACESFSLEEIWQEIESLDKKVSYQIQVKMFLLIKKLIERSLLWLTKNRLKGGIKESAEQYRKVALQISKSFPEILSHESKKAYDEKLNYFISNGVNKNLAEKIAISEPLSSIFDISKISNSSKIDIKIIGKTYFAVGNRFSLKWMRERIAEQNFDNHWQKLSAKTVVEDIYNYQMCISKLVVSSIKDIKNPDRAIEDWIEKSGFLIAKYDNFIEEIKSNNNSDLLVFVVALSKLKVFQD